MHKLAKIIAVGALVTMALPVLAQVYTYPSYPVSSPPIYNSCPQLSFNLYRGLSDYYPGRAGTQGQVTMLQQFLAARGYAQGVTGYFGNQTWANVARFQQEQAVYPITGGVGPLTRAAIQRVCGGIPTPIPTPGGAISITNVSGPNALAVGQTGTWSITTNAAYGSTVSMSVRWGDENMYAYGVASAQSPSYISQQNTFTHSYQSAGTYTITFSVTDQYGRTNSASATVQVTGGVSQGTISAYPQSGYAPLVVTFTPNNLSSGGYYAVSFGDGTSATMLQGPVTHTYAARGTYTAQFTSDLPCLHTTPQCYTFAAQQNYGSVTINVF